MIARVVNPNGYEYYYDDVVGTSRTNARWGEVWPHKDGTAHALTTGMYIRDQHQEFPGVSSAVTHVRNWIARGER